MSTQAVDRYSSPTSGTPAPYGHACANCAQSKCKCIIGRAGGPCERCRRINKECHPAKTVRRRNPRRPAVSKTTRLEEKLDSLVSLIKAGSQSGAAITSTHATAATDDSMPYGTPRLNVNTPAHIQSKRGSVSSSSGVVALTPVTDDSMGSPYNLPHGFLDTGGDPSPVEAEEYLIDFHTYKLKHFPFIAIPSNTRGQQLRQERPFLWLCIMAVGSKSTAQQQLLSNKIRETIVQKMAVQSERSVDLLLGILTFIGWGHYQACTKPFLALFSQLAMALIFDLGLNKPVFKDIPALPCVKEQTKRSTPRTMEERRAVLGCFLVTSTISSFLQKIDALRWTPHMNECLHVLDEGKQCPNDEILVQLVRLQLIAEKTNLSTVYDEALESIEHGSESPSLYPETFRSQLQDIKTDLPDQPQIDETVILQLHSTELECALPLKLLYINHPLFKQRKSLNAGLQSIKSWFDVFLSITPAAYFGLPFSIFLQLVRCIATLYLLKTLDGPCWDEGILDTVEPLLILDRVINNLEQVPILAGLDNRDSLDADVFSRTAQTFRSLRPGWEARMGPGDLSTSSISEIFPPNAFEFEFLDNDWLIDVLPTNY